MFIPSTATRSPAPTMSRIGKAPSVRSRRSNFAPVSTMASKRDAKKLIQNATMLRAAIALAAWLGSAVTATRAEQISVEAAARAAGLAVQTDTADVNGVTI